MHVRTFGKFLVATIVAAGLGAACGGGVGPKGRAVGATCDSDDQCEGRCVTGDSNYPGGYCTLSCRDDRDCPGGTACITDNGGMCVFSCNTTGDCESFGRQFICEGRERQGAVGDALVCRVP